MDVLPTRVLGLPQSIEIDKRPDKKFRQRFTGAPAAAAGSENKQQFPSLACSFPDGGASLFLIWGEGTGVSRGRARGVA